MDQPVASDCVFSLSCDSARRLPIYVWTTFGDSGLEVSLLKQCEHMIFLKIWHQTISFFGVRVKRLLLPKASPAYGVFERMHGLEIADSFFRT